MRMQEQKNRFLKAKSLRALLLIKGYISEIDDEKTKCLLNILLK
jgi:hypothetical protein